MNIQLFLFDYGGVIAPEGFQLGILKLSEMFSKSYKKMYDIAAREAAFESGYSAGKRNEEYYWNLIAKRLELDRDLYPLRYLYLDNFQPRSEMIQIIQNLSRRHRLGIFSDQTNWIFELNQKYDFFKYFQHKFISYDRGYTKRDEEFYKLPLEETKLTADRILIIDDKKRVLNMASKLGFQTYHFTSINSFREFITDLTEQ
ncbi:MAG: HAD-IA family hydrolase [Spirochaetes bacterium]|nr:HAD-IA family hydrolase [Spirochaetota bacterium]